jgi:hypothetical protein
MIAIYLSDIENGFKSHVVLGKFRIFLANNYLSPEFRDLECAKNNVELV